MKLLALCVVGALAAQDTTPPVLSLTLHSTKYVHRNCDGEYAPCSLKQNAEPYTGDLKTAGAQSATCEYGTNARKCPEPTCKAYDHHDMRCAHKDCKTLAGDDLLNFCLGNDGAKKRGTVPAAMDTTRCTKEFDCVKTITLINENGKSIPANEGTIDEIDRKLRAEWLLTYTVSDRAGNPAEPVTFTMIFQDTQPPSLNTEFGNNPQHLTSTDGTTLENRPGEHGEFKYELNVFSPSISIEDVEGYKADYYMTRMFAESCTACMKKLRHDDSFPGTDTCPAACSYTLAEPKKSEDGYDGDMIENVEMAIHKPDSTTQLDWTYAYKTTVAQRTIDTSIEGKWVVSYRTHDLAGMYGWQEKNNVAHQKVYITISDNRKPTLYVQPYIDDRNKFADDKDMNPIIECASSGKSYIDPSPGAISKDLRESWTASGWNFQGIKANEDWSTVVVSSLDGKNCDNTRSTATKACHLDADISTERRCCFQEYVLTYSDSDGSLLDNKADDVQRVVRVVDTTPPTIVLKDHEGNDEAGDGKITNSAGVDNSYGGFETNGRGCKVGDAACLDHTSTGTELLKTGAALEAHCAAGDCHDSGFFDYHALTVGKEDNVITWIREGNTEPGVGGDDPAEWRGARCTDTCDTKPTLIATLHEGKGCTGELVGDGQIKAFPEYRKGDYSILYTCTDGNENDIREARLTTKCRDIENVDHTRPVIQILGANRMTLEATHEGNYVDDGATCYDQVDGVISQNVEVSGDVVDLSKVGKYEITYNCRDSAGNTAPVEYRTVIVQQTSCPECTMRNCATKLHQCTLDHEASFDYVDAGVACSDNIDGTINEDSLLKWTNNPVDVEKTGTYVVTYRAKNSVGLWNDNANCRGGPVDYMRTVVVKDTLKPVVEVSYRGKRVARGAAKDTAVHNGAENPMGTTVCKENVARCQSLTGDALQTHCVLHPDDCVDKGFTPDLMAEQTGASNAWALAGLASAVVGVALLSYGQRRQGVATAVPV